MTRPLSVVREAFASARSQPVASVLTVLVIAGMMMAVMLTSGRTVAAEEQVLSSIDSAGTRSIVIRAEDSAGMTSSVLDRVVSIAGIEWVGAFSSATDATNALIPDGTRVPVRIGYGSQFEVLGVPRDLALPGEIAYASSEALRSLGMNDDAGSLTLTTGQTLAVTGPLVVPDYLNEFQPLTFVPNARWTGLERVTVLVVIASRPDLVAPLSESVLSVIGADDPTAISVQTSERLAELRGLVEGQLGALSRGLVLGLLLITAILVAVLTYGLVMMRRKDFGRRRALGASRTVIVALLLTQTGLLAVVGVLVGTTVASILLVVTNAATPGLEFVGAVSVLAIVTAMLAAVAPALVASRREPIRELRVP